VSALPALLPREQTEEFRAWGVTLNES